MVMDFMIVSVNVMVARVIVLMGMGHDDLKLDSGWDCGKEMIGAVAYVSPSFPTYSHDWA